jgi:surface-anchored protein
MTRRRVASVVLPLLLLGAVAAACVPPATPPGTTTTTSTTTTTTIPRHVMSIGHADAFEVTIDGDALAVQIKDDSGASAVFREADETILHAKPESQIAVPNPPGAFAFLGAGGDPVWMLPQVQNPNLLWPGASTERIGSGALVGNKVSWTLESVSGPGGVHVFQNGAFGAPQMWFTTGSALPQTRQLSVPSHVHFNWAFTAPGTYELVMRADATLANGTAVTSGPVTYTFQVGSL